MSCAVTFVRTRAGGDAVFLDVAEGHTGQVGLSWSGGGLLTSRSLIAVGGAGGAGDVTVEATLDNGLFACRDGVVTATDSRAHPELARVQVTARNCTFLTAGAPVVLQSGIADPPNYEAAISWRNRGSRYEGTPVLRRIDGAAERIDVLFRDQPATFRHGPDVGSWPDMAVWQAEWRAGGE